MSLNDIEVVSRFALNSGLGNWERPQKLFTLKNYSQQHFRYSEVNERKLRRIDDILPSYILHDFPKSVFKCVDFAFTVAQLPRECRSS